MDQRFWNTEIFKQISPLSVPRLENIAKKARTYLPNELVVSEADVIENVCVLLSGVLKSTVFTVDGRSLNASFFFAGDVFPLHMIYGGVSRYYFNTYCVKKAEVLWLPVAGLTPVIDRDPLLLHNVLRYISEYACYNKLLLRALNYRRVANRLAFWLLHINDPKRPVQLPYNQEILADILHVSRSALNQELGRLKKQGLIKQQGKEINVLQEKELERGL